MQLEGNRYPELGAACSLCIHHNKRGTIPYLEWLQAGKVSDVGWEEGTLLDIDPFDKLTKTWDLGPWTLDLEIYSRPGTVLATRNIFFQQQTSRPWRIYSCSSRLLFYCEIQNAARVTAISLSLVVTRCYRPISICISQLGGPSLSPFACSNSIDRTRQAGVFAPLLPPNHNSPYFEFLFWLLICL